MCERESRMKSEREMERENVEGVSFRLATHSYPAEIPKHVVELKVNKAAKKQSPGTPTHPHTHSHSHSYVI